MYFLLGEEDWRRKIKNIFREGKYIIFGGEEKLRRKRRKIFGGGKYIFFGEEKWGRKKEGNTRRKKIYYLWRRKTEKEKEENIKEKEKLLSHFLVSIRPYFFIPATQVRGWSDSSANACPTFKNVLCPSFGALHVLLPLSLV